MQNEIEEFNLKRKAVQNTATWEFEMWRRQTQAQWEVEQQEREVAYRKELEQQLQQEKDKVTGDSQRSELSKK